MTTQTATPLPPGAELKNLIEQARDYAGYEQPSTGKLLKKLANALQRLSPQVGEDVIGCATKIIAGAYCSLEAAKQLAAARLLHSPRSDTGRLREAAQQVVDECAGDRAPSCHAIDMLGEALTASPSTGEPKFVRDCEDCDGHGSFKSSDIPGKKFACKSCAGTGHYCPHGNRNYTRCDKCAASPLAVSTREDEMRDTVTVPRKVFIQQFDHAEFGKGVTPSYRCALCGFHWPRKDGIERHRDDCALASTPSPAPGRSPAGDAVAFSNMLTALTEIDKMPYYDQSTDGLPPWVHSLKKRFNYALDYAAQGLGKKPSWEGHGDD